ncbi:unnamed protein product [Adineta ricciae]|uniref:Uncharacterized protein n=1 Tax=Adineta ricciae TaxID=249248 RepID=A0A816DHS6_ADIRI|nr:unnamed protein product [Adineta ricciae]CAF1637550.1 unnamed protein product [Adineta ricciae]
MASASHSSLSAAEIVNSRIPLGATKEQYQKWILQKHHCLPNDNDFHRLLQSGLIDDMVLVLGEREHRKGHNYRLDELRLHSSDEDESPMKKFKPNTLLQCNISIQTESDTTGLKLFD